MNHKTVAEELAWQAGQILLAEPDGDKLVEAIEKALRRVERETWLKAAEIAGKEITPMPTLKWMKENPGKDFVVSMPEYHKHIADKFKSKAEEVGE